MSRKYADPLRNFLHFLENPQYPSVAPHLHFIGFFGLWHPTTSKPSIFKRFLFYLIVSFFFSQYIKSFIHFDYTSLKLILQYAPWHIGIVKSCFFQKDHSRWEKLINYISRTEREQLAKNDDSLDKIINKYIGRNRRITYFFWTMAFFSNISIFTEPYQKNNIVENGTSTYLYMFDGYTPFEKEPPGYYVSMLIQTILGNILSAYIVGWDTLAFSLLIFYAGQLRVARVYCVRLIERGNKEKSHQNIASFHRFYATLLKYQKLFNNLISPVMFSYVVIISVNLGVCIIEIVQINNDFRTLISGIVYMGACLVQLLIFYWHSNDVTVESTKVSYATFECNWIGADRELQREVALIGVTTTKRLAFDAGPFNEMSLPTFLGILRGSYSFFTLLNGTN
ncbi:uncharacterized protein LOC126366927 [Pectinophora gossypiella]|uniref:uncharacterized protein LOC126366927 n=1 Tax=Pectinophora gossypiella TaxID=13191 RepID=UPI00214E27D9|nr:uncharacterized protein LOC126366927 [Pectinophora gossypiella]